jgi:hypothetical protein
MGSAVASGALAGAAIGSAIPIPGVGTAVGAGIGALAGYLGSRKTKGEKELEASNASEAARIQAEQARLGGGNGGMSASKLLAAQGAVRGQAASAANEQIANAMRGSTAAGASGLQQQAVANINEGEQRANTQGLSAVRAQDLDYAEQQRQALAAQKQQLFQNQITTTQWQKDRKAQVANSLAGAGQMAAGIPVSQVPVGGQGVGSAYTNQATQFTPVWDIGKKEQ